MREERLPGEFAVRTNKDACSHNTTAGPSSCNKGGVKRGVSCANYGRTKHQPPSKRTSKSGATAFGDDGWTCRHRVERNTQSTMSR